MLQDPHIHNHSHIRAALWPSFFDLAQTIHQFLAKQPRHRQTIYYFANPGNWGDALIRAGTLAFFHDFSIRYQEIHTLEKPQWIVPFLRGGLVVYGGGGGWCRQWSHASRIVSRLQHRFTTIVLPSSYDGYFNHKNVFYYRRDQYESQSYMPHSHFCHDMAFYLLLAHSKTPLHEYRALHPQTDSAHTSISTSKKTGYFLRTDLESRYTSAERTKRMDFLRYIRTDTHSDTHSDICPDICPDISQQGTHIDSLLPFFAHLYPYQIIHTDRLHIGIAALLLGLEVHLYPSAYFKIPAVYQSSIKNVFDKAYMHKQ